MADERNDPRVEYERHSATWGAWLAALSKFCAETDRHRAHLLAAEVGERMPAAFRARLVMVELMPYELRRRELEARSMVVRMVPAAEDVARLNEYSDKRVT